MSDILIKGMEMPTSCHKCEFVDILPTCPCNQMADEDFWNNVSLAIEGHKDCPLIPVPEHGRLINADALEQQYVIAQEQREKDKIDYCNAFMNNGEPCTEWWCVEDMLENAPTVIEAEPPKGEKE